jgi:phosphoglycolate phosphatase
LVRVDPADRFLCVEGSSLAKSLVIFDLDGTLIDTLEEIAGAALSALRDLGGPQPPLDAFRYFVGDGVAMLFRRAWPEVADDSQLLEQCCRRFGEHYQASGHSRTTLYPGIEPMLDGLVERGVLMAVLSNKPEPFTRSCVAQLFSRYRFVAVLGDVPDRHRKPDPAGVFEILATAGVPAVDALYVGDTDTDMRTAAAAGVCAVGVTWGFRPVEELLRNGAKYTLSEPSELLGWLD